MRKNTLLGLAAVSLALAGASSGQAQPYSNAVMALNPAAYWPLQETVQPPYGYYVATNLGSLGNVASGYYQTWYQPSGNSFYATNRIMRTPGPVGPGADQALLCNYNAGAGQYLIVPRKTNGVFNAASTIQAPFTIEAWLMTTNLTSGLRPIITQGRNSVMGDASVGYNNTFAGFGLGQYQGFFYFQLYCTNRTSNGGPELDLRGISTNTWYHVAVTFDGVTETMYSNGVYVTSANAQTNAVGLTYVPDMVNPLIIGSGNDFSAQTGGTEFSGAIGEVAIYPSVLTQGQLANHYAAATGTSDAYAATILADGPSYYFRLNEPALTTYPDPTTYPVANNAGALGTVANGAYQPGTTPGVAGPSYAGFGPSSSAVDINGFYGGVEIGAGNLPPELNPTNGQPVTVAAWFRSTADSRFQEIVSHGDASWRLSLNGNNGSSSTAPWDAHFNPGAGPELGGANLADVLTNGFRVNDGKWHMAVGVSDGLTDSLYIDGVLFKTGTPVASVVGSPVDALLGGTPSHVTPSYNSANIRYFNGQIAHVAIWTNALSTAQVQQLFGAAAVPASIAVQPQSLTVNAGTVASLNVGARGSAPFSYQWYKNGAQVSGATSSSLAFNPVAPSDAANYFVTVANSAGSVTSTVATVTVYSTPVIVEQSPTAVQVFVGASPTFRVTALGPSLTYAWSRNGTAISGATSSSYTAANIQSGGNYTCSINNGYGSAAITPITVTTLADPTAAYPQAILADHPVSYYRLGEASGNTAWDYAGGLNATYTNALLGQPGYSTNDPTVTSVQFGALNNVDSFAGFVSDYQSFATPNGTSGAFSIEAWANGGFGQSTDAGIVALGYGNGGEQFDLDTGGSDPSHNWRFIVRDAAGSAHVVNAAAGAGPHDGNWHHLVGVCDQANGVVKLYVDGVLNNTATIGTNAGIRAWSAPMSIGSRQSAQGTPYDNQFSGNVNDVAIYNYALSNSQVLAHYYASGQAPVITQQPTDQNVNEGATAQFTVGALGTPPLAYQWYDIGAGSTPIAGATTSTLTLSNVTFAMSGDAYYAIISNIYGSVQSTPGLLNVLGGPPMLTADIGPLYAIGYAGTPFTYSVTVSGTTPLHYQWTKNSAPIAGATTSSYSFNSLVGTNFYAVTITNTSGTVSSSTATNIGIAVPTLNPSDYTYKAQIRFAGYNKGETLPNFQALVVLGTNISGFDYNQFASPTGGDLRFTDASGTREIPHEIDEWNTSSNSIVWVQVPVLAGTNDSIWAYWGNPAATTPLDWSTNGATWIPAFGGTPSFTSVYHLKEAAAPYADSTLQYPGTTTVAPTPGTGIAGLGEVLGGGSYIDQGAVTLSNVFTVSTWVNLTPGEGDIQGVWGNSPGGFSSAGYRLYINNWKTTNGAVVLESGNGSSGVELDAPANLVLPGQWHLIDLVVDHDGGTAKLYVDGNIQASGNSKNDAPLNTDANIGRFTDNSYPMNGTMDEVRICTTTNSANRIWADYMTVAQNGTFESYSAVASTRVTLNYQRSGNTLILSWPAGTLESSPTVNGTYSPVSGASSPWPIGMTNGHSFYRVKQ